MASGQVVVKNLVTGEQQTVPLVELMPALRSIAETARG